MTVVSEIAKIMKQAFIHMIRMISLLFAVSVISFALVSASPVDPVQQYIMGIGAVSEEQRSEIEAYWGVDKPSVERYFNWLSALLHGDFGTSLLYRRPVIEIISERFKNSLALMMCAWVFSGIIGFSLGCIMGMNRDKWQDKIISKLCYLLSSVPTFWLGLVFLMVFAVMLGWFPVGFSTPIGMRSSEVTIWQRLYHLVLPSFTLSLMSFSSIALHTRQKMIDVMNSEYILFARARGEDRLVLFWRHGFRNTVLPAVTLQFASFAELFGGSVLAENVFSYPGLGSTISAAGLNSDVPLLLGITLFSTLFVCVGNMIANLLYGIIDPKIREVGR
ncbi:MAG: ABC transporter permease [Lachnospiraceae bacterium]|nr:ABC transporter permease [Lachnospiraceae bacterium]